jgi:aminoglycoside-2''-adenylyltransferase
MSGGSSLDDALCAAVDALRGCPAGWAIAGGWAIDLFLGRSTRPHADVDIAVWRDEQRDLRRFLDTHWRVEVVDDHRLRSWAVDEWLSPPIHEIHARSRSGDGGHLELLLDERDATDWIYRRDPNERRALDDAVLRRGDIAFFAPEIVLLYKSKNPRDADDADLLAVLPSMSVEQRHWLRHTLERQRPTHRWLELGRRELLLNREGR